MASCIQDYIMATDLGRITHNVQAYFMETIASSSNARSLGFPRRRLHARRRRSESHRACLEQDANIPVLGLVLHNFLDQTRPRDILLLGAAAITTSSFGADRRK